MSEADRVVGHARPLGRTALASLVELYAGLTVQLKTLDQAITRYTVLQMQRDLTSARGSELQSLVTYQRALAQLSLDEGTTLERLGLKVEPPPSPPPPGP